MDRQGVIFDIQRFAVHDGPGIRTTVFFKGCGNHCIWCHNPESLSARPQVEFYPSRCAGCGKCFDICPRKAHTAAGGTHRIDRERCTGCGRCTEECFSQALTLKGRTITAEALLEAVLADRAYYEESGGGVTFSGGEPVLQHEFAADALAACKKRGIHTALQTAGNYPFARLEPLLPHLDFIMYDIKGFSPAIYESFVGGDRDHVYENLRRLDGAFSGPVAVRTPCVGGVNDTDAEIEGIARAAGGLKHIAYFQLIPYHGLAKVKYDALDQPFAAQCRAVPPERIRALEDRASQFVTVCNPDRGMIPKR